MSEPSLLESVYRTLQRRNLLPLDGRIVVGVSGGTDSLALLHLLASLRDRLSLNLHVATLDHGLRGEAGAEDARFVQTTAQAWDLPVTAGLADVRALAQQRQIGIEAAARLARYDFLAGVASAFHATHIAVAHNADDQVETILFHLLRGSGLAGLSGMAYVSPLPGYSHLTLIRPLLDVPRADLDAYCSNHDLHPRHDSTNDDIAYTRNRLRHQIMPVLRDVSPQIERNLRQLADIAHIEDDFADFSLHQIIDTHLTRGKGRISLPRKIFVDLHPALQRRFIVWAARELLDAREVDYLHVNAAIQVVLHSEFGKRAQLKEGVQVRCTSGTIFVERENTSVVVSDRPLVTSNVLISVTVPGVTQMPEGWSLETSLTPFEQNGIRLAISEGADVVLRGRRIGDRIALLGLNGHTQKLSKWMNYWGVPRPLRDQVPLLVVNNEIAVIWWTPNTMISHFFAVTPASERVIYLRFHKKLGSG